MINILECLIEMRQAVKPAIAADGLDRHIGDHQLFGCKAHAQLRDKIGQGFTQHSPDGTIDMMDIFIAGIYKPSIALSE